jgi:hypothetical protein
MSDQNLTLEKLRVKERLEAVEDHMKAGEENRRVLIDGFSRLEKSVNNMETTLFGEKGQPGLAQRMDSVLKIAEGIKWVLTKIFLAICTAIGLAVAPSLFKYLSQILTKHTGG